MLYHITKAGENEIIIIQNIYKASSLANGSARAIYSARRYIKRGGCIKRGISPLPCAWQIITTGVAGGLLCPYKGLLPAVHLVHVESLPLALLSQLTLKRLFTSFYLFVFSPVNGSIYSLRLI